MESLKEYKIIVADDGLRPAVLALLKENDLPVADLDEKKTLFACLDRGDVVGSGGLELFKDCALLRSISIRKDLQKKGLGKFIVGELEQVARRTGTNSLYLLTTTAEVFFNKRGYNKVEREEVPAEIKNTTEFSSLCPSSAVVMRKFLS
jgi:amino-acid N-acetyltransferase